MIACLLIPGACLVDDDPPACAGVVCFEGERCVEGECLECLEDDECGAGACEEGRCVDCLDDGDCGVDFLCSGPYKWLLGGFGVAPFYIKRSLLERVPPDRFGIFQVQSQMPDYRFQLGNTARRYDYATLPFAELHQLAAGLAYLERVGVTRIRDHTLGLTRRLEQGLLTQGHRLFTPRSNQSSVLCFYTSRPTNDVRTAFNDAKIDVTVRDGHVRVSIALFNNSEDVDRALAVTKRLV
jgi:selenocysteine lyase/cysteine desulfurase